MEHQIDLDNNVMTIDRSHLSEFIKKYFCKDEDELQDYLWLEYGIYLFVV